ncbi:hypothetical protein [Sphingomicrobium clamense]|uniref:Haem-binding uptake Tiki superfamily ChaN domain-containing protein n=1 Tax=Sphingomicrobium clamense TaxID=2851013 RepID=A0ABS6V486_9SPHN|nr:hypothetical protein [Sphingomicrobium sp. B8]MBW0144376.1 hypothetical protein [Sphingomicrobium sp. B8]
MLLTMLAAMTAAPDNVTLTDIEWDVSGPAPNEFFLNQLAPVSASDAAADDMMHQPLAHYGRSDLIAATSSFHARKPCKAPDANRLSWEALLERAASTRVVIVNEAHVSPWHRATTAAMLAPLRDLGYTHFAAEAFANLREDQGVDPIVAHADEPYARRTDGSYFEPVFGQLVRQAKRLGFTLAAYEAFTTAADMQLPRREAIAKRETSQASNLAAILEADPSAKILVHVGHSHVREEPAADGQLWMAARLKETTGIDPLTISQIVCTGGPDGSPRVIPVPDSHRAETGTDLVIETAPAADYRVRPEGAVAVNVPDSWRHGEGWTLVEAIRAGEPDSAIPADHLLIHATDNGDFTLYLEPGDYRIRLRPVAPVAAPPPFMVIES